MNLTVQKTSELRGEIKIPSSKSHTIRAVILASLADGTSTISNGLMSDDTKAAIEACRALGAKIDIEQNEWKITGFNGTPQKPETTLNMMNSGTSLSLITTICCLGDFEVVLDGDDSLRTRPMQPLLKSLNMIGAEALSVNNDGRCPIQVKGKITGGSTEVDGLNSQYVSSLLISTPLAEEDTYIIVHNIHEAPYIRMTMKWLDEQGIKYENKDDLTWFHIKGAQKYNPFQKAIPSDWSSAAFPLVAAAITKSEVILKGLDINDVQGDKLMVEYLRKMGAEIEVSENGIKVKGRQLHGTSLDLNSTPDALPALAVLGCFAEGTTKLYNVAQARIKETDRIKVITQELSKMGAQIEELSDGLIVHHSSLHGAKVNGHSDHRIVMALALAGFIAQGTTKVTTAESIQVTFPSFVESMSQLGAKINLEE